MPLSCGKCGGSVFRLRRAEGGAQAECISCGTLIPNCLLRRATRVSPTMLPVEPPKNGQPDDD